MREEVEVVRSYLMSKLSSILDEAEEDPNSPSGIISRFRSIERRFKSCSDVPIEPLYELIHELSECRVFAHKRGFCWFQAFWFKKNMRIRLDKIEEMLLNNKAPDDEGSSNHRIEQSCPILQDPSVIIGFESEAKKIEGWLLGEDKIDRVGIVGGIGVGKTALAQKVFSSPGIQGEFSPRIWVCLSNVDTTRLRVYYYTLDEISEEDYSVAQLGDEVQRLLDQGKRYLMVLDDVWRNGDQNLLPKGTGGAVIVTGRRENIIKRMVKAHIRMEPLSNQICKTIFFRNQPLPIKREQEIIQHYNGLPPAANAFATIFAYSWFWFWFWIPARKLDIEWGNDTRYWAWISSQVEEEEAELVKVGKLEIRGRMELKNLLLKTNYSAYLVFKLQERHSYLSELMAQVRLCSKGENIPLKDGSRVFIDREMNPGEEGGRGFPQPRGEEWMEIKLGDFFNDDDKEEVEAALYGTETAYWKSGLIVKGIYFRLNY